MSEDSLFRDSIFSVPPLFQRLLCDQLLDGVADPEGHPIDLCTDPQAMIYHAISNLSKTNWSSCVFSAKVCWFGQSTIDDRVVNTISLARPNIPLMAPERPGHNDRIKPVGWVSHVEEIDESDVTVLVAYGRLIPDLLPIGHDGMPMRGVAMSLDRVWSVPDKPFVIEHGSLSSLLITDNPAFPQARVRFEQ